MKLPRHTSHHSKSLTDTNHFLLLTVSQVLYIEPQGTIRRTEAWTGQAFCLIPTAEDQRQATNPKPPAPGSSQSSEDRQHQPV